MAFRKPRKPTEARGFPTLSGLILQKLGELGEATVESFLPRRYPEARIWRELLGLDHRYRFKRETFSALLSRFRREGFVARSGTSRRSFWRLTSRGQQQLVRADTPDIPRRVDGVPRIVIFDIPEKERKKRDAIRLELVAAGFSQLQRSVWYGERPLPEDFLDFLDALRLQPYVHIFSVQQRGTLSRRNHDREHFSNDRI